MVFQEMSPPVTMLYVGFSPFQTTKKGEEFPDPTVVITVVNIQ